MKLIYFLRKSKIFNKSRYSRIRQSTRSTFYFSLVINIIVIFAVFSLYYKFVFKLSTLWWFFTLFLFFFIFNSIIRHSIVISVKLISKFFKVIIYRNKYFIKLNNMFKKYKLF